MNPLLELEAIVKHSICLLCNSPSFEKSNIENGSVGIDKFQKEGFEDKTLFKILVCFWNLWYRGKKNLNINMVERYIHIILHQIVF